MQLCSRHGLQFVDGKGGQFLSQHEPTAFDVDDGEAAAKILWQQAAIRTLPGAYIAKVNGSGDNPGRRYIRVALVHDDAMVEAGLNRMLSVL